MPHERFFVADSLSKGKELSLVDAEFHHLRHVMRLSAGEEIELVNGRHQCARAELIRVERQSASARILSVEQKPPGRSLILAQAIPRQNRLDTILEKGCELGATTFWLFPGEHSEKREYNEKRLTTILISAMKQCGRWDLPELLLRPPLVQWKNLEGSLLFGDTEPEAPFLSALPQEEPIILCIGPEKGFSEKEVAYLRKHGKGIRLNPHILRTDTAAIAGLAHLAMLPSV